MTKLIIVLFILISTVFAHGDSCDHNFLPHSKKDYYGTSDLGELDKQYKEFIYKFVKKDGLLEKLGLANPAHDFSMVESQNMAILASLGRHAVPHWHDGAQIVGNLFKSLSVYEFVQPGCPSCRSFYNNATEYEKQLSIIMHVFGHNDFSENSLYNIIRQEDGLADPIKMSLKLAQRMRDWSMKHDYDEVMRFYENLVALMYNQDFLIGHFQNPSEFVAKTKGKYPLTDTRNSLQYLANNLPGDAPYWKNEMVQYFEQMNRLLPYIVQTKIMNEGWASIMQEVLAEHAGLISDQYTFKFAELMRGVAVPGFSNPYYLGREAWYNVRRRVHESFPKNASLIRKDKAFIEEAHKIMRTYMNDHHMLQHTLDARWVREKKLHLARPAAKEEWDENLAPSHDPKEDHQWIITSTDPKKVVEKILENSGADKNFKFPNVMLSDVNYKSVHGDEILYIHKPFMNMPLMLDQAAQMTYILSEMHGKTVTLRTIWANYEERMKTPPSKFLGLLDPDGPYNATEIEIVVTPEGQVNVYAIKDFTNEETGETYIKRVEESMSDTTQKLQEAVSVFLLERQISYGSPKAEYKEVIDKIVNQTIRGPVYSITATPTASGAVKAYREMMSKRLRTALDKIMKGQAYAQINSNSLRVKGVPTIPHFQHDSKALGIIKDKSEPTPIDGMVGMMAEIDGMQVLSRGFPAQRIEYTNMMVKVYDRYILDAGNDSKVVKEVYNKEKSQEVTGKLIGLAMDAQEEEAEAAIKAFEEFDLALEAYEKQANEVLTVNQGKETQAIISYKDRDTSVGQGGTKGDRKWGGDPNKENQKGDGEGEGEEGDQPAPGQDPGDQQGEHSFIDIPLELWGEYVDVKLPNLRSLKGPSKNFKTVQMGSTKKPSGTIVPQPMVKEAYKLGRAMLKSRADKLRVEGRIEEADELMKKADDFQFCVREGQKYLTSQNIYTKAKTKEPRPDINAVVGLVKDVSGSMNGWETEASKTFLYNLKAILLKKYKSVRFEYVAFETSAHRFKDANKFFKFSPGGGTDYMEGFNMMDDIFEKEYPDSTWDRFMFVVGDSDHATVDLGRIEEIVRKTQYAGYIHMGDASSSKDIKKFFEEMASTDEYFGFGSMDKNTVHKAIAALQKLFKND
jgi:uncharacterized sporulation protein YeaH/YhbH (DUF444 family)/spore cortex formation protein SpoVR/YcgB (stage V sporulation)